ncbi:Chaperone protein DnaK [Streptomyces hirsutus]
MQAAVTITPARVPELLLGLATALTSTSPPSTPRPARSTSTRCGKLGGRAISRFVLAHEMLHAALRHGDRRGGRDPYRFNVACDYVINGWLEEMGIGTMPEGLLHDPRLAGLSGPGALPPRLRRPSHHAALATCAARALGAILDGSLDPLDPSCHGVDLDEFYRRGLAQGLDLHQRQGRGLLPGGLVEEIRALSHPPLPWDARLARWFDEYVPRPEPVRTYARPARRQASTPGIPRAGKVLPARGGLPPRTVGVVLDTSGSRSRGPARHDVGAHRLATAEAPRRTDGPRGASATRRSHAALAICPLTEIAGRAPGPRARRHGAPARHRPAPARGRPRRGPHRTLVITDRLLRRAAGPAGTRLPDPAWCAAADHFEGTRLARQLTRSAIRRGDGNPVTRVPGPSTDRTPRPDIWKEQPWQPHAPRTPFGKATSSRQRGRRRVDSSGSIGEQPVTWASRAEAANGKTSPEELLAAAHSKSYPSPSPNILAQRLQPADPPSDLRRHHLRARRRPPVQRLREAAEKAKIELSSSSETTVNLPYITASADGPLHLDEKLTRAQFQELTADLLERCKTPFHQAVKDPPG